MTEPELRDRAGTLVHMLRTGATLTETDRTDMLALLGRLQVRGSDAETLADEEHRRREGIEREANALAAVVADMLDGAAVDDVVDDLPHDARRRVLAYRHQSMPGLLGAAQGRDQFGRLPKVPARAAVMRERVRTYTPTPPEEGTTHART